MRITRSTRRGGSVRSCKLLRQAQRYGFFVLLHFGPCLCCSAPRVSRSCVISYIYQDLLPHIPFVHQRLCRFYFLASFLTVHSESIIVNYKSFLRGGEKKRKKKKEENGISVLY
ncbi:hypothetical protein BC938DRAFT_482480 [Jimgerdemannia flammicorona]|uniref:Uncharacterized protein n=1 Tax=Jimgerdemannia flammicorona TaxID=994334 RepID=A0A433QE14_9FUNG|nr:hypothetical protein BC938DRAFT_482480 [Jimgerdemannia flammicorona]